MAIYKLMVMTFDGEYQVETPAFETITDAWDYSNDMGSKWFFYPFPFVITGTGKTIKDTPEFLEHMRGKRVNTISQIFRQASENPETQNMMPEEYLFAL